MKSIKETKEYNYQINGSKFISICYYVETQEEIKEIIEKLKKENKKAKHICYAYKIENHQKAFDDGEPANSAGKKILDVIISNNLENILIVVIRYMSGTKLGIGLLSRSYSTTASLVVKDIQNISELSLIDLYIIKVDFDKLASTIDLLKKENQIIFSKENMGEYFELKTTINIENINQYQDAKFIKKVYYRNN